MLILNRPASIVITLVCLTILGAGCHRAPTPPAPKPKEKVIRVSLAAVGDVLLARGVARRIKKHGANYPFEKTKKIISGADIAFFNLECPLSKRGVPQPRKYLFRGDPALAKVLHANGFDVASLANNHTLDYGRTAMLDTAQVVQKAGIVAVGAGKNRKAALGVRIVKRKGLRVGFIAYTDLPNLGVVRLADKPTVAGVDSGEIRGQVARAKAKCDVLVVSFHWGIEYMKRPTERQQKLARLCIDSGADLVLGHHPHVTQTVEVYKGKPIVYSMGGFVWDGRLPGTKKSAIYMFELRKSFAYLVKAIPIDIVKSQPRVR